MKKIIIIVLSILILIGVIIGVFMHRTPRVVENPIIASLPKEDSADCYYSEGFQDYTDYCKYYYGKQGDMVEKVKNNQYFKAVTNDDIKELNAYFDNFEGWLKYVEYKNKYDFQRNYIDLEDYFYIENKDTCEKYSNYKDKYSAYNVYFFDTQTKTLFFIHNNI